MIRLTQQGARVVLGGLVLVVCTSAQVTVEEEVITDSIDVFAYTRSEKSPGLAMGASILLPGLGHHYLGRQNRALAYFSAEAAFLFGVIYCEQFSRRLTDDAKIFAWERAWATAGTDKEEYFWQNVGRFMSSEEYNRVLELNREEDLAEKKYVQDDEYWRWESDSLREEYNSIRVRANNYHVASTFFIAAMVIKRVVAFIDTRVATKFRGVKGRSLRLEPGLDPRTGLVRLTASAEF